VQRIAVFRKGQVTRPLAWLPDLALDEGELGLNVGRANYVENRSEVSNGGIVS
jgi:hypothetical protein